MSAFYNRLASSATRLIKKYGKLTKFNGYIVVKDPNPSKPSTKTLVQKEYMAVFTRYKTEDVDGTRVQMGDMKVLVQGDMDPAIKQDGSIIDPADGQVWKVMAIESIIPGPLNLLYKVQVRK